MATDVDICKMALGYVGDPARITSIFPPDGSVQAGYCQRFYPICRDALIEQRNWSFATRRDTPAAVEVSVAQWRYSYALPANTLDVIAVLPPQIDFSDDVISTVFATEGQSFDSILDVLAEYQVTSAAYTLESASDGTAILYTNQPDATLLYVIRVTDTTKFTPLFIRALARLLSSDLAGPIIKGDAGRAESKGQLQIFQAMFSAADVKDANRNTTSASDNYIPSSIRARR